MRRLVCLGELLVDFTPCGLSGAGLPLYEQNPGGAPANVAVAAALQGADCSLVSAVGGDFLGRFLTNAVKSYGVDVGGVQTIENVATTLAFVSLDANGERDFAFARGADTALSAGRLNTADIENCGILHFGSLPLTSPVSESAVRAAVDAAKRGRALVSFDPNWRADIWRGEADGIAKTAEYLRLADVIKMSEDELSLFVGGTDVEAASGAFVREHENAQLLVVTLGADGCAYRLGEAFGRVGGRKTSVVDTTGAGDAFWGSLLASICRDADILTDIAKLEDALKLANVSGSLAVSKRGAIPSLPTLEQARAAL